MGCSASKVKEPAGDPFVGSSRPASFDNRAADVIDNSDDAQPCGGGFACLPDSLASAVAGGSGVPSPPTASQKQVNNWQRAAVDKGTELLECLSTLEGTALEKLEAFSRLLVSENYVNYASVSVLSKDNDNFMVLTSVGSGNEYIPQFCLLETRKSGWSVQRVVEGGGAPHFWSAAGDAGWKLFQKTGSACSGQSVCFLSWLWLSRSDLTCVEF